MKNKNKFGIIILLLLVLSFVLTSCNFPMYFDTYNVTGKVTDPEGTPIENAVIEFSNGYDPVTTSANGKWSKTGLGGTVIISVHKAGFEFSPVDYTINQKKGGVNFTSDKIVQDNEVNQEEYNIDGTVTLSGDSKGIPGVTINFESVNTDNNYSSVKTDNEGNWTKRNLVGEVKILPEINGWIIEPNSRIINYEDSESSIDFIAETKTNFEFYSASGEVIDNDSNGLAGIKLLFTNDGEVIWTAFTDKEGGFDVGEYLYGEVVVKPEDTSYTFEPTEITIKDETTGIQFRGN